MSAEETDLASRVRELEAKLRAQQGTMKLLLALVWIPIIQRLVEFLIDKAG
jgi:hypothetical protein